MNQTYEFGRFYYVIATGDVVRCVASKPSGPDGGRYWFVANDQGTDDCCFGSNQVALIPHMTSWDYDGPKHPEEGWRFLEEGESLCSDDQYFDDGDGWSLIGRYSFGKRQCVDTVYRRRIEPDHVAELDKAMGYAITGNVFMSPGEMKDHWKAVKAEILTLREQSKRGDA
ncbi:MAG: hypothetical protein AAGG48_14720 [Planctomycetota bacterium]